MGSFRQGECFRIGHFPPSAGGRWVNCPKRRSGAEQSGHCAECLDSALCPISVQHLNRLCVAFKPGQGLLEKYLALTQSGLATLAIIRPLDVLR